MAPIDIYGGTYSSLCFEKLGGFYNIKSYCGANAIMSPLEGHSPLFGYEHIWPYSPTGGQVWVSGWFLWDSGQCEQQMWAQRFSCKLDDYHLTGGTHCLACLVKHGSTRRGLDGDIEVRLTTVQTTTLTDCHSINQIHRLQNVGTAHEVVAAAYSLGESGHKIRLIFFYT